MQRILILALIATSTLFSALAQAADSAPKKIAVIAAMDSEVRLLKEALQDPQVTHVAGADYYVGKLGAYEALVVKCGVGKVSAAICAQNAISIFQPDYVVNTGCAGGIAKGVEIGDLVVSTETVEWDIDMLAIGEPRGYVTILDAVRMKADEKLVDAVLKAADKNKNTRKGLVVSGDQFVSRDDQRKTILDAFPDALCAEMEGAAIGHVCAQNGVPFCVVRCMSDSADGNSKVDFPQFAAKAGEESAALIIRMTQVDAR